MLPNIRFAALRFQCVRLLNQLSSELEIFVPVAPLLLDAFGFAQLQKPPAGKGKDRALDWSVLIKVSKADAQKQKYQDGMMSQGLFLLAGHLHNWAYSIAFPEMAMPTSIFLKKLAKKTKIVALQQRIRRLVSQVETQTQWVLRARESVDFSPKDTEKVAAFLLNECKSRVAPFSKWYDQEVAVFEKREVEWRSKAGAEAEGGVRADDDDDDEFDCDDDAKKLEPKNKLKKKRLKPVDEGQQKAFRIPRPSHSKGADVVDELRLSDLEEVG